MEWVFAVLNCIKILQKASRQCTWGLSAKAAPSASLPQLEVLKKINVIFSLEKHFASWWGTVLLGETCVCPDQGEN